MVQRDSEWYDEFWNLLSEDEDDRISAIRLIGEMFAEFVIERDGDVLRATERAMTLDLSTDDHYLIRRIEDAVNAANEAGGSD